MDSNANVQAFLNSFQKVDFERAKSLASGGFPSARVESNGTVPKPIRNYFIAPLLAILLFSILLFSVLFPIDGSAAQTPSLVAAYSFNENSGNIAHDSSTSGNNGHITTPTWTAQGKYGAALNFGSIDNKVVIPDASSLNLTNGMTLSAWVYPTANRVGWDTIIYKEYNGDYTYSLYQGDANTNPYGLIFSNGAERTVTYNQGLPLNQWTFLAFTYDGSKLQLYVNAVFVGTTNYVGTIPTSSLPLDIGGNAMFTNENFTGKIDEVRVYNIAQTQAAIQADMNTPISASSPTPTSTPSIGPSPTPTRASSPTSTPRPVATPTPSPTPTSNWAFPLRISSNGRFLTDQNNKPFFMVGDAAWSLVAQLNNTDIDYYLKNRYQKGFNTILVNVIEHKFATHAPANIDNVKPFTSSVFTTPNEPYFARVDYAVSSAAQRGMVVLLDPLYLGWDCGSEGWCQEVQAASTSDLTSWGQYVGNRYKKYGNIIWVIGGDVDPRRFPVQPKMEAFVSELRQFDTTHLSTAHNAPDMMAITPWPNSSWPNLNDLYTDNHSPYVLSTSAYNVKPPMPYFMIEADYENSSGSTQQLLRSQSYYTALSGGIGHVFGNCPIWNFAATPNYVLCDRVITNWKPSLDLQGSINMSNYQKLFSAIRFESLIPTQRIEL